MDPARLTPNQRFAIVGWAALGMVIVVLLVLVLLAQIVMWNRAANGQAAFEYLSRQVGAQVAPAAPAPKPTPSTPSPEGSAK